MKAIEQYFPVVLYMMLYKAVLTFGPLGDETLKSRGGGLPYKNDWGARRTF